MYYMNARFTCLIDKDSLIEAIESLIYQDGWTKEDIEKLKEITNKIEEKLK